MAIYDSPSYVDANTFTVSGDHTSDEGGFDIGRALRLDCDTDGVKYGHVLSAIYSDPDTTVVTTEASDDITSNLTEVITSPVRPGESGNWHGLMPKLVAETKTADYSVTTSDLGKVLRMSASAVKTFTLPSVDGNDDGKSVRLENIGRTYNCKIATSDTDRFNLADDYEMTLILVPGDAVTLQYSHSDTEWVILGATGAYEMVTNSHGHAFATIQEALDDLYGDGWVEVPAGTWSENVEIVEDDIILRGTWGTVIDGAASGHAIEVTGDNVVIQNLACKTTAGGGNSYDAIAGTGSRLVCDRVWVKESDRYGIHLNGAEGAVLGCTVEDTDSHGVCVGATGDDARVNNNLVDDAGDDGVYIDADGENCIVTGNRIKGYANEAVDDDSSTSTVANNETT